jgi:hypothetical protein
LTRQSRARHRPGFVRRGRQTLRRVSWPWESQEQKRMSPRQPW